MPGKSRIPVFFISFIFCSLFRAGIGYAQHQPYLDKKISISFSGSTLASALNSIAAKSGVKFSYNPELIQSGRRVYMKFSNLPLREVLKQLLNDPGLAYREIGNQIVIYRGDPSQFPLQPNQQIIQNKPQILPSTKKNPDTVFLYQLDTLIINQIDTVFRSITITRFDTLRLIDTVFVPTSSGIPDAVKPSNSNDSALLVKLKFKERNGFFIGFNLDGMTGSAKYSAISGQNQDYYLLSKQTNTGSTGLFSIGILAGYDYKKLGIRSGLGYTVLGDKFSYDYSVVSGGFYRKDTLEEYYTVIDTDTNWIYITDSTWIPKEQQDFKSRSRNSYHYIDIPLSFKFRFFQSRIAEIYALAGGSASFLVANSAMFVTNSENPEVATMNWQDLNPVLWSWHAGIGTVIKIKKDLGLLAEIMYRDQLNNQYKNLKVFKEFDLVSFRLGAVVKL